MITSNECDIIVLAKGMPLMSVIFSCIQCYSCLCQAQNLIEDEWRTLSTIIILGFSIAVVMSFGTDAGVTAESSSFNYCMGHTSNFEVTSL